MSPPVGSPAPSGLFILKGLINSRYGAVASPSVVGLVAMITSDIFFFQREAALIFS
jgi:hypothetical protein